MNEDVVGYEAGQVPEGYDPHAEQNAVLADLENAGQEEVAPPSPIRPVTDLDVAGYRQVYGGTKQEAYRAVEKEHMHEALANAREEGDLDTVIYVLHTVVNRLN